MAATSDALLEHVTAAPEEAAIFLDFDGVLAPIVDRPEDAYPPAETRAELARLAGRYALVAVVSGRAGDDVREPRRRRRDRVRRLARSRARSSGGPLAPPDRGLRGAAPWPPSQIELKGLSVAFHYRDRDDEQAAVRELEELAEAAREEGLVARFGRKVLEVLPPVGSNKGTAVRHLLDGAGLGRALVAGDDITDLDAFLAVEELEHRIRVAVLADESPSLLADHAELVLGSTAEFLELLRRL